MKFKDIKNKGGAKFVFVKDVDKGLKIPYMVVDMGAPANYYYTIITLIDGKIATFGENDDILEAEINLMTVQL